MRYERTGKTVADVVSVARVAEYLRLDASLADEAVPYVETAANEVEAYANLALLDQTIIATTDTWPGQVIAMPVGPAPADATVTVDQIELDGTVTPVDPASYWLESGQFPRLHFIAIPSGPLRVTYGAGFGDTADALPTELTTAVLDHGMKLYDMRAMEGRGVGPGLSHAAARIVARYRKVSLG